jgi:hypothetical protein
VLVLPLKEGAYRDEFGLVPDSHDPIKANPEKDDVTLLGFALEQIILYVIFSQFPRA